jgi:hypothetical protein
MNETFLIRFPTADDAEANQYANSLADHLRQEIPPATGLKAEPIRTNKESQDFGATVVLILGTAAATAVAKGIQAWLKGHTGASIEIVTKQGRVVARNIESKSAADIAAAFTNTKA